MELKNASAGVFIGCGSSGPPDESGPLRGLRNAEDIIGRRVRIRAVKAVGSARLLDGLTGTVIALHPIASGWVKLDLDENPHTPYRDWSVAVDRLVLVDPVGGNP